MSARVTIIAIGDMSEASLLRLQLEGMGADVRLCPLGKPSAFFTAFDFYGQPADIVVLSAHGDEDGIVFPEMAPGADSLELPGDRITPELIGRVAAQSAVVVSTACDTGKQAFVDAFHAAGASIYIAPEGYPDGVDVPVLLALAFFKVLVQQQAWVEAIKSANDAIGTETRFSVFPAKV